MARSFLFAGGQSGEDLRKELQEEHNIMPFRYPKRQHVSYALYDGLGRRVGMSSTLSGHTRYGYSGLGLNPIEEVFMRGFGFPNDPRGSRNEGRTALKSRESLEKGRYMPHRKNRLDQELCLQGAGTGGPQHSG